MLTNFKLLLILCLGFMAFLPAFFWISLYIQRIWHAHPLQVAIYLLPMPIAGLIFNVVAAFILHRVSNKLLMGIGALACTISFMLYALNKSSYSYWVIIFPALCLAVLGADFQFNVANVSLSSSFPLAYANDQQMYVMSALPENQQSMASGLIQTVTRLCVTIGMSISTAIFSSVQHSQTKKTHSGDEIQSYTATFWFFTTAAGAGLLLVPFVTIETQGGRVHKNDVDELMLGVAGSAHSSGEEK